MPSPTLRGIDTYRGHRVYAESWAAESGYAEFDFAGKRVAVVGTDAFTVRIVPELVDTACFVKVFQHPPRWVLPRLDESVPAAVSSLLAKALATQRLVAPLCKAYLRAQVKDPWLRRQLTPDVAPGSAHMLISSDYYPALQRANCKLIDWPIATLSPVGIRTSDGVEHHLDAIVFAAGHDAGPGDTQYVR